MDCPPHPQRSDTLPSTAASEHPSRASRRLSQKRQSLTSRWYRHRSSAHRPAAGPPPHPTHPVEGAHHRHHRHHSFIDPVDTLPDEQSPDEWSSSDEFEYGGKRARIRESSWTAIVPRGAERNHHHRHDDDGDDSESGIITIVLTDGPPSRSLTLQTTRTTPSPPASPSQQLSPRTRQLTFPQPHYRTTATAPLPADTDRWRKRILKYGVTSPLTSPRAVPRPPPPRDPTLPSLDDLVRHRDDDDSDAEGHDPAKRRRSVLPMFFARSYTGGSRTLATRASRQPPLPPLPPAGLLTRIATGRSPAPVASSESEKPAAGLGITTETTTAVDDEKEAALRQTAMDLEGQTPAPGELLEERSGGTWIVVLVGVLCGGLVLGVIVWQALHYQHKV